MLLMGFWLALYLLFLKMAQFIKLQFRVQLMFFILSPPQQYVMYPPQNIIYHLLHNLIIYFPLDIYSNLIQVEKFPRQE